MFKDYEKKKIWISVKIENLYIPISQLKYTHKTKVIYTQARGQGVAGGGGQLPPMFFVCVLFCLSAQWRTVMMIIPLPHYGNNFATKFFGQKKSVSDAPPPPPPPPLSAFFRAGAVLSETFGHFAPLRKYPGRRPCIHGILLSPRVK